MVLYLTLADALETHEAPSELRQAHEVDERDARRGGVLENPLSADCESTPKPRFGSCG